MDLTELPVMHKFGDIVTRDLPLNSSGHTLDLLGLSKTTDAPSKSQSLFLNNSVGRSLENSLGHLSLQYVFKRINTTGTEDFIFVKASWLC